jgi:hypothetical protein
MKLAPGALALLAWATACAAAHAQAGPTREQVLRELAEARRMGDIIAPGCGGGTLREAFPNKYPPRSTPAAGSPVDTQRTAQASAKDRADTGPDPRR